jgi:hypothetical protein
LVCDVETIRLPKEKVHNDSLPCSNVVADGLFGYSAAPAQNCVGKVDNGAVVTVPTQLYIGNEVLLLKQADRLSTGGR